LFKTRETVFFETPARRAMSLMVVRRLFSPREASVLERRLEEGELTLRWFRCCSLCRYEHIAPQGASFGA
jgi:hypothetical protein